MAKKSIFVQVRNKLASLYPRQESRSISTSLYSDRRPMFAWSDLASAPAILQPALQRQCNMIDEAFVRQYDGDLTLDPTSGLIFCSRRMVDESTDLPSAIATQRIPAFHRHILPYGNIQDAVISLHHKFHNNYFHFFNNIATKAYLIDLVGLPPEIPLVIPSDVARLAYAREAIGRGLFGARPIVEQRVGQVIRARRIYVIKPFDADRPALDFVLDALGVPLEPVGSDAVYISRSRNSPNKRIYRNEMQLRAMLSTHGVAVRDPGVMTLAEQIATFSAARIIISAHGAGLTNIVFRRESPTTIVEMFNPNLMSPHYYRLSMQYKFTYHALCNKAPIGRNSIASSEADLSELDRLLRSIVS